MTYFERAFGERQKVIRHQYIAVHHKECLLIIHYPKLLEPEKTFEFDFVHGSRRFIAIGFKSIINCLQYCILKTTFRFMTIDLSELFGISQNSYLHLNLNQECGSGTL